MIQWPSWSKDEDDSNASEIDENTHLINGQAHNTPGIQTHLFLNLFPKLSKVRVFYSVLKASL